ncbi:hypothetical protein EIP86_007196 [Pleurotus ostreatoroseus]|nr:hypothetical protein EIP86_007196 [Pleurotus ostreatoroseus]
MADSSSQHVVNKDVELPAYSPKDSNDTQVQHTYDLHKNNRKLLSLTLRSKAKSPDDMPKMQEAQTVSGTVTLDLDSPVFVRSVTVTIIGEIEAPWGVSRFLNMRKELYSVESKEGSHSPTASPPSATGDHLRVTENLKLEGTNVLSFSLKLPRGVGIPFGGPNGAVSKYLLPASLHDLASRTSIVYQIVVRVKKGMLSSDYRLSTPFEYLPLIRPEAPSLSRQIAYSEGIPPLGPTEDPDGWKTSEILRMAGTLFNTRPVEISCSMVFHFGVVC